MASKLLCDAFTRQVSTPKNYRYRQLFVGHEQVRLRSLLPHDALIPFFLGLPRWTLCLHGTGMAVAPLRQPSDSACAQVCLPNRRRLGGEAQVIRDYSIACARYW